MTVDNENTNELMDKEKGTRKKIPYITIFVCLYFALPLLYICRHIPTWPGNEDYGRLYQCQSNLKNIGTALEMYATDNVGHFPVSLSKLTPDYLKEIPICKAAGRDTYSASYTVEWSPDAFTMFCSGHNHAKVGVSPNYPQYNSRQGLVVK